MVCDVYRIRIGVFEALILVLVAGLRVRVQHYVHTAGRGPRVGEPEVAAAPAPFPLVRHRVQRIAQLQVYRPIAIFHNFPPALKESYAVKYHLEVGR